jgi:hypothetical protein
VFDVIRLPGCFVYSLAILACSNLARLFSFLPVLGTSTGMLYC